MSDKPVEVYSLADLLCEEMLARGWTTLDVARRMDGDTAMNALKMDLMLCVQDDRLILDDETFAGLSQAFGVSEKFFRGIHLSWLAHPDKRAPFECPEDILTGSAP